jgi:redox-sensitive bicupin YhaK (pirin superfamily)
MQKTMDRKSFLKKSLLGVAGAAAAPSFLRASDLPENSTYNKLIDQVGFNHLPVEDDTKDFSVLHRAETRGTADHGWLKARFTFSFSRYYNPKRMNFGVLRVLNDDIIAGGGGFPTHPHDNMEIITIPIKGALEHKDSMGNIGVIKNGEVQVMSAGTGLTHSEYNHYKNQTINTLQIWMFPKVRSVKPRYQQITLKEQDRKNRFQQILSPSAFDEGCWIHQDAWFHLASFDRGKKETYNFKKNGNGLYAFVISGNVNINGQSLKDRDGYGIWNINKAEITAESNAEILLMEVPMQI